jgi:predicted aconitase
MKIVAEPARMLGINRLIPIEFNHIDGCLYHGESGVLYCETLAEDGTHIKAPSTTSVGALSLLKLRQTRLSSKDGLSTNGCR